MIEDNGSGRKPVNQVKVNNNNNKSLGMNVTEERIHLINNLHGTIAGVIIEDQIDETMAPSGTKITLTIPYIIHNN